MDLSAADRVYLSLFFLNNGREYHAYLKLKHVSKLHDGLEFQIPCVENTMRI